MSVFVAQAASTRHAAAVAGVRARAEHRVSMYRGPLMQRVGALMLLHFPKSANLSVQTVSRMTATPQAASSAATLRHLTAPHCARFLHDLPGKDGSGLVKEPRAEIVRNSA